MLKVFTSLIEPLNWRIALLKLLLIASVLFSQSCSNDERLEGLRQPVLTEQKLFETNKKNQKLALGKPRNISSWTHGGGGSTHSLGNIAFSADGKFSSHFKTKVGPKGSYSELIVENNQIFIMTPNGYIVVYNDKGQFLWELSILPEGIGAKNNIYGGLAIYKDKLAVTSSLGELLLISVPKRRVVWRYDFKRPFRSAPIFHKGYIFGLTGDDIAISLDLKGKLRWTKKGPQKNTKVFATVSPASSGNKVLFPFSGGSLVALNAVNGIQSWEVNLENSDIGSASASLGDFASDPAVFGSTIFAVGAFGETFASKANGKVLWRNNIQSSERIIMSGNAAYYSSNDSSLGRINPKNGKIVFLKRLPGKSWVKYYGPLLLQNKLLVIATDKNAYWFSAEDGTLLNREKIATKISSPPVVANKKLMFVSEDGKLNILN
ncbi:PQQ-binding-like beta-propeller repeat protein [Paracoccaceae bacterium]|nr:PQQ-binding-like beta-propeller repeat protein [Paracoccaceae bacterium]